MCQCLCDANRRDYGESRLDWGTTNVHEHASCASGIVSSAQGVLRQETCGQGRCMLNEMILLLILALALIPGVGHQFCSEPLGTGHTTWRAHSSSIHKPNSSTPNQLVNQGIRSKSRDIHAWRVRASDRKGEVQKLVSRLAEIFQMGERGPTAQRTSL